MCIRDRAYIDEHLSEILLDETNQRNLDLVESRRQASYDTELQIQKLIEEFNDLVDQRRWAEAEAIARQAEELDPTSPIVVQLTENARFLTRTRRWEEARSEMERTDQLAMGVNMIRSSTAIDDQNPYQFNADRDDWIRRSNHRLSLIHI